VAPDYRNHTVSLTMRVAAQIGLNMVGEAQVGHP
jgi:hypothetical protein